jgi:hypothetical protein
VATFATPSRSGLGSLTDVGKSVRYRSRETWRRRPFNDNGHWNRYCGVAFRLPRRSKCRGQESLHAQVDTSAFEVRGDRIGLRIRFRVFQPPTKPDNESALLSVDIPDELILGLIERPRTEYEIRECRNTVLLLGADIAAKSVVKGRSRLEVNRSIHMGQGSIPIALDQHRYHGAEEIDSRFVRIQLYDVVDIGQGTSLVAVFPENK